MPKCAVIAFCVRVKPRVGLTQLILTQRSFLNVNVPESVSEVNRARLNVSVLKKYQRKKTVTLIQNEVAF